MSLKGFHILLISLSSLLGLVMGGWSTAAWRAGGGGTFLAMAVASFALAAVLAVYVVWFARSMRTRDEEDRARRRTIRPLAAIATVWLLGSDSVPACSACYGEASGPMIDAAKLGVYLLFGLVLVVQLGFVLFFLHLRRQGRADRSYAAGPIPGDPR